MPDDLEAWGIHQLSVRERLELIEKIWDSLPEQVSVGDVPAWHLAELANRRAAAQRQPGVGKPWRDVISRLEDRS
jgi:putative addiction module component (TIGR02574 family)